MFWKKIIKGTLYSGKFLLSNYIFLIAIFTWLLTVLFRRNPHLTEIVFSRKIYPVISVVFSNVSNLVPFSINDLIVIFLIVSIITLVLLIILKKLKLKSALISTLKMLAILYTLFYWMWGFNYFRDSVYDRINIENKPITDEGFEEAFNFVLNEATNNYSLISSLDMDLIDSKIEKSYMKLAETLKISYPNGKRKPKLMFFSRLVIGAGISGYFGPFCNEIHMNKYLLPIQYPVILAHEKAHQFGITNEAEASFFAWLVCQNSNLPEIRYSANLYILWYFLRQIQDEDQSKRLKATIPEEIINDMKLIREFWREMEYPAINAVQTKLYDIYLKGNSISEGVKNYQEVVKLVCDYQSQTKSKTNKGVEYFEINTPY